MQRTAGSGLWSLEARGKLFLGWAGDDRRVAATVEGGCDWASRKQRRMSRAAELRSSQRAEGSTRRWSTRERKAGSREEGTPCSFRCYRRQAGELRTERGTLRVAPEVPSRVGQVPSCAVIATAVTACAWWWFVSPEDVTPTRARQAFVCFGLVYCGRLYITYNLIF